MKILVLNAGSSSQKSYLYELTEDNLPVEPPSPLWKAKIDWTVEDNAGILEVEANGTTQEIKLDPSDRPQAMTQMLDTLVQGETQVLKQLSELDIVGHRVVHGGADYSEATLITAGVKDTITRLIPIAPNHNPAHLEGIKAIEEVLEAPQLAVFDTAFHTQMPLEAKVYPIPYEWFEKGIRRYGFHGINHKYCAQRTAQLLDKPLNSLKIITCHLGNGCSLAAIKNGCSINTTMGFTPLEGLMMGTRSGSIDPAIPIYLMREHGMDADRIDEMLNKASGLKGVSGESSDMRQIVSLSEQGSERAQLAFNLFVERLKAGIGAMLPILGGLDALVFTAGIGENSATLREKTCAGFEFLGLKLDQEKNASPQDQDIATPDSTVRVLVIAAEEDWAIAQECWHYLNTNGKT